MVAYILAARQYIENDCHLRIITQTLDYTIDDDWPCYVARGYYRQRIEFPIGPVQSVTSISYIDGDGSAQTLGTDQYVVANAGISAQSGRAYIEPAYNVTWPTVRCQSAAITVRFVAGWDLTNVPHPIMQALRLLISHANENREAVASGTFNEIPLGVDAFTAPYRNIRIT
jgi:uncharacterized phiE125 gp8 family phage protein